MGLSAETIAALEETKASVEEFYDLSLGEVDDQVEALRGFDVSISKVATKTTEAATDVAMSTITSILA